MSALGPSPLVADGWRLEHDSRGAWTLFDMAARPVVTDDFTAMHTKLSTDPRSGFVRIATVMRRSVAQGAGDSRGLGRGRPTVTRRTRLGLLAVTALAGFVALSLDVTHHGMLDRHDGPIDLWVMAHTPHTLERIASAITQLGGAWSLIALTAAGATLLLRSGRRADAGFLVAGLASASLVTNGLKIAFGRPRPASDLSPVLHSASFPSGHTSGSTVVFVLLAVLLTTRRRPAVVAGSVLLAGLVGVTRVVVEAHWVTDVLAGYCLGAVVVAVVLIALDALRLAPSVGPECERDPNGSGHEEREGADRPLAEHRAHHLAPMDDLGEPERR